MRLVVLLGFAGGFVVGCLVTGLVAYIIYQKVKNDAGE